MNYGDRGLNTASVIQGRKGDNPVQYKCSFLITFLIYNENAVLLNKNYEQK